jgi:hypothetical protein
VGPLTNPLATDGLGSARDPRGNEQLLTGSRRKLQTLLALLAVVCPVDRPKQDSVPVAVIRNPVT